jgi:ferredoxin
MSKSMRLSVDPIRCDAYGHCAELLPELIELDEWGYPMIADEAVPEQLRAAAQTAVAACPRLALRLTREASRRAARTAA